MTYMCIVGCENDKTGKRFEPGDTVSDKDFSPEVIANWLEIGVLAKPDSAIVVKTRASKADISTEMPEGES